jgi:hypothetical protein
MDDSTDGKYMETAVFMKVDGIYCGEYVAACTLNRCGYLGMKLGLRK